MVSPHQVTAGARVVLLLLAMLAVQGTGGVLAGQSDLSIEEQLAFLKKAKVVSSRPIGKGITGALRLTLKDGSVTHDAAFQSVEQRTTQAEVLRGKRRAGELRFADSFHYNIAAWELARLLNLQHMMPATTERSHGGKPGALSWWVDNVLMDEAERETSGANPPRQLMLPMIRQRMTMFVFAELVQDTDRNKGNVIFTRDWKVVMLDFTRAFRLESDLRKPDTLQSCDRNLLARLRTLEKSQVSKAVGHHLTSSEVDALMKRRAGIVDHFDDLIAKNGEAKILY